MGGGCKGIGRRGVGRGCGKGGREAKAEYALVTATARIIHHHDQGKGSMIRSTRKSR